MTLSSGGGGESDVPACGPPTSFLSIWPAVQYSVRVCSQIQGRQCGVYVGAVEDMMCIVCVSVTV